MPLPAFVVPLILKKIIGIIPPKVILILVLMATSAYGGWYIRNADAVEELAEARGSVIERVIVETVEVEKIITEYVEKEAEVIEKIIEVEKEVERVKIVDCNDLGAEFVSLFNRAAYTTGSASD